MRLLSRVPSNFLPLLWAGFRLSFTLPFCFLQDPRPLKMDMIKNSFAGKHQVCYEKPPGSASVSLNQIVSIKVEYVKPSIEALNTGNAMRTDSV